MIESDEKQPGKQANPPSPGELVACFAADNPTANLQAAESLIALFHSDDRLERWGAVYYLLHSPFHPYLPHLLNALQVSDQPKEIQSSARVLSNSDWLKADYTPASLSLIHAKTRILFHLTAGLFSTVLQNVERKP